MNLRKDHYQIQKTNIPTHCVNCVNLLMQNLASFLVCLSLFGGRVTGFKRGKCIRAFFSLLRRACVPTNHKWPNVNHVILTNEVSFLCILNWVFGKGAAKTKKHLTTFNGGSLGSCIDEERSQLRYVMWIAEPTNHRIFERKLRSWATRSMSAWVS